MGHWNAHHRAWADRGDTLVQDGRGEELRRWQRAGQWVLVRPEGATREREIERGLRLTYFSTGGCSGNQSGGKSGQPITEPLGSQ